MPYFRRRGRRLRLTGYRGTVAQLRARRRAKARARNVLRRGMRRYKRRRPTVKSLQKQVTNLYKRDEKKYYYTRINNLLVSGGPSAAQAFTGIYHVSAIPNFGSTDAGTGAAFPAWMTRENDSAQCNLRNIRIHMTLHASHPEAYSTQKCYVALVKSRVGVGSASGIGVPNMTEIWDYDGAAGPGGNLLAPWELFRKTMGEGSELYGDTFKILKEWKIYLQPQQGVTAVNERTTGNDSATGTIISSPEPAPPAAPLNYTYTKTRHSEVLIKHTHSCMNANLDFQDVGTSSPLNVKYFLVCVGNGTATNRGFRLNAVIKTNFVSS